MAARAIASGTVSFGLVSIPVKLFSATEPGSGVHFNLLHKDCGSRLKQQYLCIKEDIVVPRDQMVKGYEFAKDQYVTFTNEELKELEEKATQSIDIAEFVPADKVDPIYYDKAYYLGPDKGGDKAYRLLVTAMRESGRVALAQYAARGKGYLVMLRPGPEDRLIMQQLRYADEVRSSKDVVVPDGEVKGAELKLAMQLIDQIAHDSFDPGQYKDEVKARIENVIQQKIEGQEISVTPEEQPKAQIIDLMEALKASLAKKDAAPPAEEERKPAKAAAPEKKRGKKAAKE
jgi:DNA end-binding protein Ku